MVVVCYEVERESMGYINYGAGVGKYGLDYEKEGK